MTVLLLLVLAVIGVGLGYLIVKSDEPDLPPLDPEAELKAALRLHEIRRKLDVADLKHQGRQDAQRLKREIAETLRDDRQ